MKISSEIASIANVVGEERAIELMAKNGFNAWDFSMFRMFAYDYATKVYSKSDHPLACDDYLKFARRLKKVGLDNGIVCNQSHAPFPTCYDFTDIYIKRAIECTAEAGGSICVVHPMNLCSPEENAEMFLRLLPFAKEYGVKIATENMWCWDQIKNEPTFAACATPESFNAHLDAVNDDYFVACLDIGHAEMRPCGTTAVEMITALGNRLQALHIHDNDLLHDSHLMPFTADIDFEAVISALKSIGYSGYLTLEADRHIKTNKCTAENADIAVKELADSALKLAHMFEK